MRCFSYHDRYVTQQLPLRCISCYIRYMPSAALKPSEFLRHRLPQLRDAVGWSQSELAERMCEHRQSWVRSTVAKIEAGTRQVTIDELVTLAVVLGVPLASLITPPMREEMQVTPAVSANTEDVWHWLSGLMSGHFIFGVVDQPAHVSEKDFPEFMRHVETLQRRFDDAAPDYVITAERLLPGLRRLLEAVAFLQREAGTAQRTKSKRSSVLEMAQRVEREAAAIVAHAQDLVQK